MNRKDYLNKAMRKLTNRESHIEEDMDNTSKNEITDNVTVKVIKTMRIIIQLKDGLSGLRQFLAT